MHFTLRGCNSSLNGITFYVLYLSVQFLLAIKFVASIIYEFYLSQELNVGVKDVRIFVGGELLWEGVIDKVSLCIQVIFSIFVINGPHYCINIQIVNKVPVPADTCDNR